MKILIVEDEEMIREGISDYLTDCGYETIEAADGKEALEKFSSYEVALVLLDIQMPKLNGLQVLAEIRKTSQVPVLMLTAFQDEVLSAFWTRWCANRSTWPPGSPMWAGTAASSSCSSSICTAMRSSASEIGRAHV